MKGIEQTKALSEPASATRFATVGERYRQLSRGDSLVPQIRLAGNWLSAVGFKIGDRLRIEILDQEIRIIRAV